VLVAGELVVVAGGVVDVGGSGGVELGGGGVVAGGLGLDVTVTGGFGLDDEAVGLEVGGVELVAELGGFDDDVDWPGAGVVGWLAAGEVGWEVAVSPGIGVLSFWTFPWSPAGGVIVPGVSGIVTVDLLYDCIHRSTVDT
jgi:hypothetical protein